MQASASGRYWPPPSSLRTQTGRPSVPISPPRSWPRHRSSPRDLVPRSVQVPVLASCSSNETGERRRAQGSRSQGGRRSTATGSSRHRCHRDHRRPHRDGAVRHPPGAVATDRRTRRRHPERRGDARPGSRGPFRPSLLRDQHRTRRHGRLRRRHRDRRRPRVRQRTRTARRVHPQPRPPLLRPPRVTAPR